MALGRRSSIVLRDARRRVRSASYLRKWVVLGAAIGVVGGLGAILFYTALEVATHLFLGVLAGYVPPTPTGEGRCPDHRCRPAMGDPAGGRRSVA